MPEPTTFLAVEDLDAAQTLAAAEAVVRERRALEVRELELALHWADLHGHDPCAEGEPVVPEHAHPGALEAALDRIETGLRTG